MSTSAARIEANRRNAQKSTGPRTEAGKEASRANSLKHGLTGAGVVLPCEDQAEVDARFEALGRELAPAGDAASRILARQVAMLSVRSERAFRHDAAATAERTRLAVVEFDDARRAEARHLLDRIANDPAATADRLRATPEGCDLLKAELRTLRDVATGERGEAWTSGWEGRLAQLAGRRPIAGPAQGDPVAAVDAELARVEAARAALDLAAIDRDRAEAADRALVDTGPDGVRAWRYATATERALFRAFGELRQLRRDRERADAPPSSAPAPRPSRPAPESTPPVPPSPPPTPAPTRLDRAPTLGSFCSAGLFAPFATEFLPIAASRLEPKAQRGPRDRRRRPKLPL